MFNDVVECLLRVHKTPVDRIGELPHALEYSWPCKVFFHGFTKLLPPPEPCWPAGTRQLLSESHRLTKTDRTLTSAWSHPFTPGWPTSGLGITTTTGTNHGLPRVTDCYSPYYFTGSITGLCVDRKGKKMPFCCLHTLNTTWGTVAAAALESCSFFPFKQGFRTGHDIQNRKKCSKYVECITAIALLQV